MQLVAFVAAIAAIVPAAFASLTINTPASVVECEPTQLVWSGGQAPYYVSVIPDGQVSATPLKQFPPQNDTTLTWTVDLSAGLNVDLALKDSTGQVAYSSRITIQQGSTSCVSSTGAASATGSSSSGSSTGSSGSTAAAGTTAGTTPAASATGAAGATSGGSSGSSTTSASGSRSSTTSGAGRLGVSTTLGVAGIMGLVGAALF